MQQWPFNLETCGGRPGASPEKKNKKKSLIFEAPSALRVSVDTKSSSLTVNKADDFMPQILTATLTRLCRADSRREIKVYEPLQIVIKEIESQ